MSAIQMPELDPKERIRDFSEVPLGYTAEMAGAEAARCRRCKDSEARCIAACPLAVDVPRFIHEIAEKNYASAYRIVSSANPLPGVCGRICPQESLCGAKCPGSAEGEAIFIGHLERFVGDWHRNLNQSTICSPDRVTGHRRVAVLGSGPAGLACAAELARRRYDVTVLDASAERGGFLAHTIPAFRLPAQVLVSEIEGIRRLGVKFERTAPAGAMHDLRQLLGPGSYHAAFVGTDTLRPINMDIPGQTLGGVFDAQEFLLMAKRVQDSTAPRTSEGPSGFESVVVAGGGNAAIDCARAARRMGAKEITVVYWRSLHELPARPWEVEHARQEGIQFLLLSKPVRLLGNEENRLRRVQCLETELGEPDDSGRARPHPRGGSDFQLAADTFVAAVGQRSAPVPVNPAEGLKFDNDGCLQFDRESYATGIPGVFAGGTIPNGASIAAAARAGQDAARAIHQYLQRD